MKLKKFLSAAAIALFAFASNASADNVPAFPGAEGHGRYTTTGGRGGNVYHVTTLVDNSSTKGSLRWALKQSGPRTIVFDVSGYIDLTSDLDIPSNTTIAGQTAPGDGITLRYRTVKFTSCDNVIVRYIRFRRSQVKDVNDGADATWGRQHNNIILDHCSFSWSIDEIASFYDNRNFTMQWCNLNEALNEPGHSKGAHSYGGIWGGKDASFHHNFLSHMQNRAPRFNGARYNWSGYDNAKYKNTIDAERVDFRNCVMYNWGNGNGCYGGPGGGYVNIVNNYYKAGPGTVNKTRVTQVSVANSTNAGDNVFPNYASRYYINGNYVTAAGSSANNYDWSGVIYDSGIKTYNGARYCQDPNHYYGEASYTRIDGIDCVPVKLTSPIDGGDVTTHSAVNAYEKVLLYSGASLVRDACDARYAEEAKTGTTTYTGSISQRAGIIDKIGDATATTSGKAVDFPDLKSETRPAGYDSDGDGIPDAWEDANGLNKNNASDGKAYTLDSKKWYTNLEVYLNSLVEHITKAQNEDALTSVDEYYPSWKATGVENVTTTSQIKKIEYFSLDGKPLAKPQQGVNIRRITYSDNSKTFDKVMKK